MDKFLAKVSVPVTFSAVQPLQQYMRGLAEATGVDESKLLHVEMLVEELLVNIASYALADDPSATIEITAIRELSAFGLRFHYRGVPYGYDVDRLKDERSVISMGLINGVSSAFSIREDGKAGQTVDVKIALPHDTSERSEENPLAMNVRDTALATDETSIRTIRLSDMKLLVQCLYSVFGYNYSADYMYDHEALARRKADGLYEGFVAVNSTGEIVGHVGMLKNHPDDTICESGQAFVMPRYGKRQLFAKLKQLLIDRAEETGLQGIFSHSVTGHPFTQRGNLSLGCVETGLLVGFIPGDVESNIHRPGEGKRQSVLAYFRTTSHGDCQKVFLPEAHAGIIRKTYCHLGIERDITTVTPEPLPEGVSVIGCEANTVWNQAYLHIDRACRGDFERRVETALRNAVAAGCSVCYVSLPLDSPLTASVAEMLQSSCGFFYAGIMPYEKAGTDTLMLQCLLAPSDIVRNEVITASGWGAELCDYIFANQEENSLK